MHKATPLLIASLLMTAACAVDMGSDGDLPAVPASQDEDSQAFIPGSIIVQFDEATADRLAADAAQTKSGAFGAALDGLGVTSMERLFPDAGEWEPRHREAGLHRWFRLTCDPLARPLTKAAEDLSALPGVVYSEPERRIRSTSYFNDPYASRQWALYNDGSRGPSYEPGCDINVVPVWDRFTAGSPDVIVAVLDGGVQLDHPDLAANCIPGGPDGSKSFVLGFEGYDIPVDDHGTHVAGVIAAVNDNGIGVSGIAGGRDGRGVRILSCPILMSNPENPDQTSQGDSYNAMVWAADHGAVISQNSWGYVYKTEEEAMRGGVGAMGPAIDYFIRYAGCDIDGNQRPDSPMKGGVVIFAAGNEAWSIGWPAAYEPVIAVGATNAQFTKAGYSNSGDWVDICAPGGDARLGTLILSTIGQGGYGSYQGTSMACPQVSGVAALLASYFGGEGFTNEMLKERLLGGASSKISPSLMIGPMVDALGAFCLNGTEPPVPVTDISAEASSNTVTVSWKVTADPDDVKTLGYLALAAKDADELEGVVPGSIPASVMSIPVEVGTIPVGETLSVTFTGLDFDTHYSVAVIGYDYSGHYSELSGIRSARTGRNNPPVISTDYTGDFRIQPFAALEVTFTVTDPDGHDFQMEVNPGSEALSFSFFRNEIRCRIAGNAAQSGTYTARITATDSYGACGEYQLTYEILENHAPVVVSHIPDMLFDTTGESHTLDLSKYFRDEDGEQLAYSFNMSDNNVAHLNASGNTLTITTLGFGLTTAMVTVTDACKASVSLMFRILIRDGSRPIDLYPNPVKDVLYIRPGEARTADVQVSNKAGAVVFSREDSVMDPFSPLEVDFKDLPGGVYYVKVGDDRFTVVKQ